jgi:hypothetical protein
MPADSRVCIGCHGPCQPNKVVCWRCWQNVTSATRKEVYRAYREEGNGSPAHRRAILRCMYEARGQYDKAREVAESEAL